MLESGGWFWRWLADQPAYIAVGSGMCFVLIIAPAMLTAVAFATTHAEGLVERLVGRFILSDNPASVPPVVGLMFAS